MSSYKEEQSIEGIELPKYTGFENYIQNFLHTHPTRDTLSVCPYF